MSEVCKDVALSRANICILLLGEDGNELTAPASGQWSTPVLIATHGKDKDVEQIGQRSSDFFSGSVQGSDVRNLLQWGL